MPGARPGPNRLDVLRARMKQRLGGVSPGFGGLVCAWFGGVAIVRLTGATPVLLILAAGAVLAAAAIVSGWLTVHHRHVAEVRLSPTATVGVDVSVDLRLVGTGLRSEVPRPVWIEL